MAKQKCADLAPKFRVYAVHEARLSTRYACVYERLDAKFSHKNDRRNFGLNLFKDHLIAAKMFIVKP